ncbi:MAG TPA: TonB-dependent receptor, partial [Burkholderiaceae bacterium]|nr:TonB-dependent receptor [Burkholderiaceae bacterium]
MPFLQRARALAPACFLLCAASAALGQYSLDPVVVTATRTEQRASDVVAETTVLTRADLARSEARTLAEVLAATAGIQFAANGGLGQTASVFVRGLESRHVLLLVDGLPVGSATVGTPSLDNLPLELIERIEIVRGPLTSLYGSGAMGAVIQVFTRRGASATAASAAVGSNRYARAAAGVGIDGPAEVAVSAQHLRTDGFSATNSNVPFGSFNADDDPFKQSAGVARLGAKFGAGWRADALLLESRGTTHYDDGAGADAQAKLRNSVAAATVAGRPLASWQTTVRLGRSVDVYDTRVSASPFATLGPIETEQTQLSWENGLATPFGQWLLLAERTEQDVSRPGTPFTVSSRTIDALGLGYTLSVGAHDVQASLRRDRNSQFGGQTTGAAAYAYALTPAWRIGAGYGESFTAPSFNQLYFPGFGNPNLLPEEGEHYEVFGAYTGQAARARLTAFQHEYVGFISAGPAPVNLPLVRIRGASLDAGARLGAWAISAGADYVDPRNRTAGANFNRRLPRRALASARADV